MTRPAASNWMQAMATQTQPRTTSRAIDQIKRIAAAIDDRQEGRDAAVLMQALSVATDSDPMLIAVEPDLSLMLPYADWSGVRRDTKALLGRVRDDFVPNARIEAERDVSVARGIERLVTRYQGQLLVVGSNSLGVDGKVSIGHTTRQLMHDLACPIAIAPRGLSSPSGFALHRIAVGFDGGIHASAALELALPLARRAGAELIVRGVIDDRIPLPGWAEMWLVPFRDEWEKSVEDQIQKLEQQVDRAVEGAGLEVRTEVVRGVPAKSLAALSADVDLIVIGSRRWGAATKLLLGGCGEALAHSSRAALMLVPAPAIE